MATRETQKDRKAAGRSRGRRARGGARDAEDAQAVPVSVLSRRSGVPIATIKYYIREGLIRSDQDPGTEGAQAVVDQIQLIRGLVHVVGLSIRQVRQILALVRDPELSPAALMTGATVTLPLAGPRGTADADDAASANARETLAAVGFDDPPDAPYAAQLLAAIALADECGIGMDTELLAAYAGAARACAAADFAHLPLDSPSRQTQAAVLGTVIYEPVLLGLRRLAHRELAGRFPSSSPREGAREEDQKETQKEEGARHAQSE